VIITYNSCAFGFGVMIFAKEGKITSVKRKVIFQLWMAPVAQIACGASAANANYPTTPLR